MIDLKLLEEKVQQSGLKKAHIASKMGVSSGTFYAQLKGKTEFRVSHIAALSQLIGLTAADIEAIFFGQVGA